MEDEGRRALRRRIAQRPASTRFSELRALLEASGWSVARIRGSHHIFVRGSEVITIPYQRPQVLRAYVLEALRRTGEPNA